MSNRNNTSQPGLNFGINIVLNFGISDTQSNQMDFCVACSNNDITRTKKLKEFFFEILGLKNEKEFNQFMKEPKDYAKEYIRKRMIKNTGRYNFSELMKEKIHKYVKEENVKNH